MICGGRTVDLLKKYYIEEQKAELEYLCSGDADAFCKKKKYIRQIASRTLDFSKIFSVKKSQYNLMLNYVGDQSLLNQIECIEKNFLPVRKKVSNEEYKEQFQTLFRLRNQFARTAGFNNYLEYQYMLLGIDIDILEKILDANIIYNYSEESLLKTKIQKWKNVECLKQENQIKLLKEVLGYFNLQINWQKVKIHYKNLPQTFIGNCVSINVPDESHVLINIVSGLSGFSILMHEIGHAYYYNNIHQDTYGWSNRPYNAVIEEFIALVFEDLVYSSQFLHIFLDSEEDLLIDKLSFQMSYLCCCAMFEKNIYSKDKPDFDSEWKDACEKFSVSICREWRRPHFFLSYPGFFSVDVIARYLVQMFYKKIGKDYTMMYDYLQKNICKPGLDLDYYREISHLGIDI